MIPDKTLTEIKAAKSKAEHEIYQILKKLEEEVGLQVESVGKKTTAGGTKDPWCSMDIKLNLPI